jgi:GNAT superfamily N-acetyltransferase
LFAKSCKELDVTRVEEMDTGLVRKALAFLEGKPFRNLRMAWALRKWGPFDLGLAEQGRYLLASDERGLRGVLFYDNQGMWRLAAAGETALALAEQALLLWGTPQLLAGLEEEVDALLDGIEVLARAVEHREEEVTLSLSAEGFRPCSAGGELAGDGDLEDLVALERMLQFELLGSCAEDWVIRSRMLRSLEDSAALVRCDGRVVAKAEIEASTPGADELGGVYTLQGMRRRGFASSACTLVCAASLARGKRVRLETQRDNAAAIGMYESLGFEKVWPHLVVRFG